MQHFQHLALARAASFLLADQPLFLDTETTGLGADDVIVEIAIIDTDGTKLFASRVWTDRVMDAEVVGVHGITNQALEGAPCWADIADQVNALLEGRVVACHNAPFDAAMLAQTAAAAGIAPPNPSRFVCTMDLVRPAFPERRHVSLRRAMEHFGASPAGIPGNAHEATYDARCCRALVNAVAWAAIAEAA